MRSRTTNVAVPFVSLHTDLVLQDERVTCVLRRVAHVPRVRRCRGGGGLEARRGTAGPSAAASLVYSPPCAGNVYVAPRRARNGFR